MEFHVDLFIIRINEQERIVEQSGGGGEAETHRWRIVDVDAEGVLGREAILGVRRPHFIASAGVDVKGPAAIGGRLRWHLVYLYGSGERRPAFLDRSSADGFVFLERNVASEREESGGQGETVSWARSR